ncbi:MAG: trypsin-like peptidase domain-containing protein [Phycisphaerae bacterium]|nr:trypsin-like peptidase domain-containing protein [Phycisphaerae bacterium]
MHIKHTLLMAATSIGFLLLRPGAVQAIVNADNPASAIPDNTAAPSGLPQWNNVGSIGGASGIYVGNGWVLTADHVGAGNFTLDGTTYDWNGKAEIRLSNPADASYGAGQSTDLVMFQLTAIPTGVANLDVASTSPAIGTTFYNVGYGLARNTAEEYFTYDATTGTFTQTSNTAAPYQGFGYGSPNTKSWGQNSIVGFQSYNIGFGPVNAFYSTFTTSTDQIVSGDSGGGVFNAAGTLIGVNDAIGEYTNQPAGTAFIGDQSDLINIAPFYSQITQISGVPEPSCLALLTIFGLGILLLPRKPVAASVCEGAN